ncbi:MAG: deoxycytidine deaminase [Candidatus Dojkabacteria bacterium]|nr:deoxycytidine deaminase [Candidatus Dojkabacteria bacterium]
MILKAKEIKKHVKEGNITIEPFNEQYLKPNSYIYHLSDTILEIDGNIDTKQAIKTKEIHIPQEGITILPHKLYLGTTQEILGSKKYVPSLIGRARTGKLGLFTQITADLGQLGKAHKWTLEIHVVQPLKIYPNMEIGQITFWDTKGKVDKENVEYYATKDTPETSKLFNQIQS